MTKLPKLHAAVSLPEHFKINEAVASLHLDASRLGPVAVFAPPLGPLAAFVGDWHGNGFNTIFRPNGRATPTPLPVTPPSDNDSVLELNLTSETLSFSTRLGSVPTAAPISATFS